jgi:hypothetical protein
MGAYDEADVVERVWGLLRDYGDNPAEQLMTDTEITLLGTRGAEAIYSKARPIELVDDLNADGTAFLTLPTDFADGFSIVLTVETPPDSVPAEIMDPRYYTITRSGLGALRLTFLGSNPGLGQIVRLTYTGPRVMSATAANTTVLDSDFIAFCDLAASICADAIAAKYARTSEPAFNADVVNYRTRAQEWRDIAKRLWDRWQQQMGGAESGSSGPADAYANWDLSASWGTYRYGHPRMGR